MSPNGHLLVGLLTSLLSSPGCWTDINNVSPSGANHVPVSSACTGADANHGNLIFMNQDASMFISSSIK
jgi:hypothetical protein